MDFGVLSTAQTEGAKGLGRKAREEIGKGNQIAVLRFPAKVVVGVVVVVGVGRTSGIPGFPSGVPGQS